MAWTPYEIVVVTVLWLWLTASALGQVPIPLLQGLRRWDQFGLVPDWRFFAPQPATGDFHLLYRDQTEEGHVTDWVEISIGIPRRWWNVVWNPGRRQRKAMFDLATELAREVQQSSTAALQVSVPYLAILCFVSARSRPLASTH